MSSENAVLARGMFDGINNAANIIRQDADRRRIIDRQDTLNDRADTTFQQSQEDRKRQIQRNDTQYEQKQQDRQYALERRGITENRADSKYERNETDRVRLQKSRETLNAFMVNGDLTKVNQLLNEYTPDGVTPNVIQKEDGSYWATGVNPETGKQEERPLKKDDVGKLLMRMGKQNVFEQFEGDLKTKQAAAAKQSDREFQLSLERTKAGLKGRAEGNVPQYAKELADLAKEYNGKTYENGVWSFDEGKAAMASSHAALSEAFYLASPGDKRSTNMAHRNAAKAIDAAAKEAEDIAQMEKEQGALGGVPVETRSAQILEAIIDKAIGTLSSPPSAKSTPEKATGNSNKQPAGKNEAPDYYEYLKNKYPDRPDAKIRERVKQLYPDYSFDDKSDAATNATASLSRKDAALNNKRGYMMRKKKNKSAIA